jgi:hypothetical protein
VEQGGQGAKERGHRGRGLGLVYSMQAAGELGPHPMVAQLLLLLLHRRLHGASAAG